MDDQVKRYEAICKKAKELSNFIEELCPEGVEKALAISNLVEVLLCAYTSLTGPDAGYHPDSLSDPRD